MVTVGLSDEGVPEYSLKRLDNGFLVPDTSVNGVHRAHQKRVEQQIEVGVEADELGYDYVLHPEIHFHLITHSSPNPLLTQTVLASRTEDVRLMQMANILPWHDPIRLAEQLATLDIVSDGRVDVGIGTGTGPIEAEVFGQYWGGSAENDTKRYRLFEEKYEIVSTIWTEDLASYHGQFHDVPPDYIEWENYQEYSYVDEVSEYEPEDYVDVESETTTLESVPVYPQPKQEPHPQIWRPAMSASSIDWTARRGINACCHCHQFSDAEELIARYYEVAEAAGWPDHRPEYDGEPFRYGWDERRRRGVAAICIVFNTEVASDEAFERWKRGSEFSLSGSDVTLPPAEDERDVASVDVEGKLEELDAPIVGDTEEIIDQLARFEAVCGYEDLILVPQINTFGITHEEHLEQVRSFANDVVPYFEDDA